MSDVDDEYYADDKFEVPDTSYKFASLKLIDCRIMMKISKKTKN